ncbi:MAG: dipeptidase [Gemmatimonadetes bacterium]|nr:dipeptidase [Gemmatimonadota bacterium]
MSQSPISRRAALKGAAAAAGAVFFAPMVNRGRYRLFARVPTDYSERAVRLVTESLVIDMLSPLTINNDLQQRWVQNAENFTEEHYRLFLDSGIDVFHIAVGIGGLDAFASTLQFVAFHNGLMAGRDEYFMRVDSAGDFARAKDSRKIGVLIGLQNSDHFRRLDDIDLFHALGQRVSQLTYNSRNRIGNGSTERVDGGLSDFGVAVVERMNEVGMAVDVSHSGDRTTLDAFEVSKKPVLITHSNVRKLVGGHPRAKADEAIRAVGQSGGVMGISGVRNFVTLQEPTTIEHLLDHYDYVRDMIGVEHLGVGSDIDLQGYDDLPADQYQQLKAGYKDSYAFRDKIDIDEVAHPKRMFDLTEGLIRRGYTDDHIRGILGANFARVLSEIWRVPPRQTQPGR